MQAERFWAKVDKNGPNGCWIWLAGKSRGYGRFANTGAHRVAYELLVGPIPEGLQIDHLCRNPPCVNPAHLEPVTQRENTMRGFGRPALNAAKTHCDYGHPFSEENTKIRGDGHRDCRTCHRLKQRRRRRQRHQATRERWSVSDVRMAQRDASWYSRPNVRSPKMYHVIVGGEFGYTAACNPGRLLLSEYTESPLDSIKTSMRCRRNGCRARWEAVEVGP